MTHPARALVFSLLLLTLPTLAGRLHAQDRVASTVGDRDNFGFGPGEVPCASFDNSGGSGIFDVSARDEDTRCFLTGSWSHALPRFAEGVGQFTIRIPYVFADEAAGVFKCSYVNDETLYLDGELAPGFLSPNDCTGVRVYTWSVGGPTANRIAGDGSIQVAFDQNGDEVALDYSEIVNVFGAITAMPVSGAGQRGIPSSPAETPLVIQLVSGDANNILSEMDVKFRISATPNRAAGMGLGVDDTATSAEYVVRADAMGRATAHFVFGDQPGEYRVAVEVPRSISDVAYEFVLKAEKPAEIRIQETPATAPASTTERVIFPGATRTFYAVGYDRGGTRIALARCNWSTRASGPEKEKGAGILEPSTKTAEATFSPTKAGKLTVRASLVAATNISGDASLRIPGVYLDVDGEFNAAAPVSDLGSFLPGATLAGASLPPEDMPQEIAIYYFTEPSATGTTTLELVNGSAYEGVAMNMAESIFLYGFDMEFSNAQQTLALPFDPTGVNHAHLRVKDYAARADVKITIPGKGGHATVLTLGLPLDSQGNGIADRGWIAQTATIRDTGLAPGSDEDNTPALVLPLPDANGAIGDNLTTLEEYRGFIVRGQHRRTNPFHKDYFVEADDFDNDVGFAYPALPTTTHSVRMIDIDGHSQPINPFHLGLLGDDDPFPDGHINERVVSVFATDLAEPNPNGGFIGANTCGGIGIPLNIPNNCARVDIYMNQIAIDLERVFEEVDPAALDKVRRSTVAHECGHAVNLFHNEEVTCMMATTLRLSTLGIAGIPTSFCSGIPSTMLTNCLRCGPDPIPVTNFAETDTLRIKGEQE